MNESPAETESRTLQAIRDLAASFDYEEAHSRRVTGLSLKLFDALTSVHARNAEDRFRLHCAAILHDIGVPSGGNAHHKTALKLIMETPAWPLSERERGIIASIARYHRKALPTTEHEHFRALEPAGRERVRALAALLRLGDALDRCHLDHVRDVSCKIGDECVVIHCTGTPCDEETQAALKKGNLFEKVFGKTIAIAWNRTGNETGDGRA